MWNPRATTSALCASSPSKESAGGQEEQLCEVKSSTTTGRVPALAGDDINTRLLSSAHVIGYCENLVTRSSSNGQAIDCDQSMRRRYAARARAAATNPNSATPHIPQSTNPPP